MEPSLPAYSELVVRIARTHTLYDPAQLSLDAHLEGDLGIDSVVVQLITTDIAREVGLPPQSLRHMAFSSLRQLAEAVQELSGANGSDASVPGLGSNAKAALDAIESFAPMRAGALAGVGTSDAWRVDPGFVARRLSVAPTLNRGDARGEADEVVCDSAPSAERARLQHELPARRADADGLDRSSIAAAREPARALDAPSPVPRARHSDGASPVSLDAEATGAVGGELALTCTNGSGEPERQLRVLIEEYTAKPLDSIPKDRPLQLEGLGRSAREQFEQRLRTLLPGVDAVRLSDCDTIDKLVSYVQAARRHVIEPLDAPYKQAEAPVTGEESEAFADQTMKDFAELPSSDLFAKAHAFSTFYRTRQRQQLFWYGMPSESRCQNRVIIYDEVAGRRRQFLNFASNNYLGLANHPHVVQSICEATSRYGATNTGCRIIGGTNIIHKRLEERLAHFKKRSACIVYPSGYSANLGCIAALVRPRDAVIVDKYNHMSIVDGCKLAGGQRRIYQHDDMRHLEEVLAATRPRVDGMLVVTDGVFSMHGNVCQLPTILMIARKYGARVLVDDAHATGVLGEHGAGTSEHFNLKGEVDLELGTLSKALAGMGGFVVGDESVIEYLRFFSNSYVFAATIPAGVAAGVIAALDVMEREPHRLNQLRANIHHLRGRLIEAGFNLSNSASAIVPIVIGDDRATLRFGRAVRARGLFCQTVVYPGVSVGDARLRVSVTAEHTREDLELAAEIFVSAADEAGVPRYVQRPAAQGSHATVLGGTLEA